MEAPQPTCSAPPPAPSEPAEALAALDALSDPNDIERILANLHAATAARREAGVEDADHETGELPPRKYKTPGYVSQVGVGAKPPRLRYSHHAMADMVLMNPGISQNSIAAIFGRTPSWVSTIFNSDAFQTLLAQRRAELIDPEIVLSLRERATAVATKSMQVIQEKLHHAEVSDNFVLRAFELSAKATGLGGNAAPPPAPNAAEFLPELANRLMRLQGRMPQSVEDAVVVPPDEGKL